ncbi:flavoprotein [Radiobacillus kanasensis]|uniref:flavoprotein n=1 Tax=Radiobacillus kanasensis TaxID=2844358 RepID=UPI001E40DF09|nr:flavoprotein [Radiobacillus kanasensis]UFU00073.1 flavoprotein [Radiobacillus kanasensis]
MDFKNWLVDYKNAWKTCDLDKMKQYISKGYQAREVRSGEIMDFGYEESINGWEQGFQFVKQSKGEWELKELAHYPLHDREEMVVMIATIRVNGERLNSGNLFFETFAYKEGKWQLVRSYIEAGLSSDKMDEY